jgi:hypothetical protein
MKKVPESVNPQKNSRVKTSMVDNLCFAHLQGLRHPVQESQVSLDIEVDQFAHKVTSPSWAAPSSTNVPLWKVNSVIDGLDSQ